MPQLQKVRARWTEFHVSDSQNFGEETTPVTSSKTSFRSSVRFMAASFLLWLLSFFGVAGLLGLLVFQLMCLSDLEFDYINPYDSATRINRVVLLEFGLHAALCLLFLLSGHWIIFLANTPLLYYHIRLYQKNQYLVDVTEIFNQLNSEKKYRMIKLGFVLLLFFVVIFRMLLNLIDDL